MTDPYYLFSRAKEAEAQARNIRDNEITPGYPCGATFGTAQCLSCSRFASCENFDAPSLFEKAWRGYCKAEKMLRAKEQWDEHECDLLAQILLAIHIHPRSGLIQVTPSLQEAQNLWEKLYADTGKNDYLQKACFCNAIRKATVVKVK